MHSVAELKTPVKDFINPALSDDLLACVLSYLTNSKDRAAFASVCKRWCSVEGVLHLRIRFPGGKQLAEHAAQALARFPNLLEITIDERGVKKSFWWKGNASKAVMESTMRHVAQNCATLEKLNFYSCTSLTDKILHFVVGECPSIRSLRLVRCDKVGRSHKKRLKPGTLELEDPPVNQFSACASPHFATACTNNLVQLNLYGTGIDDAGVAAIGHYCKGLERLSLAGCHDVTDSGLRVLGDGCKNLQDLNIVRCWRVTDKGLAAIGESCGSTIKFLSLGFHSEVHDRGLRALAVGCPNLELLAISDCNNVSDAGIRTVVRRCKGLRILKITACLQVKDTSLDVVGRLATSLEILELRSLIITDRALLNLSAAGGSTTIKRIVVAGCPYISDKGLLALANQETFSLRSLDVRHCREISTPALARFMVKCSTLEQMDVDKGRTEQLDEELRKLRASMA
jgi:F-box/leucine-rich repeat protein 2/20